MKNWELAIREHGVERRRFPNLEKQYIYLLVAKNHTLKVAIHILQAEL